MIDFMNSPLCRNYVTNLVVQMRLVSMLLSSEVLLRIERGMENEKEGRDDLADP